jgi:phosphate transport system protein
VPEEIRKSFHRNMADVTAEVSRMAAMTTEMLSRATDALLDADMVMAQAIIDYDDAVDEVSAGIEEKCFSMLALQAPMAADLRTIAATMRINTDLERSADLAVNIAKGARRIYGNEIPSRLRGIVSSMSEESLRMLHLAVDAYVDCNGPLGAALDDIDNRLDQLQAQFVEQMVQAHTDGQLSLQPAVQLALIARYYERIGDHAVNMGERVAFMASGQSPEPHLQRLHERPTVAQLPASGKNGD